MSDFSIAQIAYALYVRNWIDTHTVAESRLSALRDYYIDALSSLDEDIEPDDFGKWLFENGFSGSCYACFDEFLNAEYLDREYITKLFDSNARLLDMYFKDIAAIDNSGSSVI